MIGTHTHTTHTTHTTNTHRRNIAAINGKYNKINKTNKWNYVYGHHHHHHQSMRERGAACVCEHHSIQFNSLTTHCAHIHTKRIYTYILYLRIFHYAAHFLWHVIMLVCLCEIKFIVNFLFCPRLEACSSIMKLWLFILRIVSWNGIFSELQTYSLEAAACHIIAFERWEQ